MYELVPSSAARAFSGFRVVDLRPDKVDCYNGLCGDLARVEPVAEVFVGFQNSAARIEAVPVASTRTHWYVTIHRGV
jgi:hypothetical protein